MELSFTKGTFVSNPGELNYKQVLEDFQRANTIRILTYNISGTTKMILCFQRYQIQMRIFR